MTNIFNNVPDNIVECLNVDSTKIKQEILKKINCHLDCSDNWEIELIHKTDICFDNSNNGILYKYEYQEKYYEKLNNGDLINDSPIKYCKCTIEDEKCLYCSNTPMINNNICIECDNSKGYYEIENSNINENKECYKDPIGYYLDNEVLLY